MMHFLRLFVIVYMFGAFLNQLAAQTNTITIQPGGNVGIGTSTPAEKLQVNGNVKVNGGITDQTGLIMPAGIIMPFSGSVPPAGWLLCNGAAYSKTGEQKDLFAVIGSMYGDSAGNFKVPDLRGAFIMGAMQGSNTDSLGRSGGPDTHTHTAVFPVKKITTDTVGTHTHKFPANWYNREYKDGSYNGIDIHSGDVKTHTTQGDGVHKHEVEVEFPKTVTGSSAGKNRPQWAAMNYIIKY